MTVLGIDPARDVAKVANERGIETLNTFFNASIARQLRKERGPATIITANNVFANLDNLDDICAGILELLAPDGVFIMETSYLGDVVENTLVETVFHEHISYFSVKPLVPFFQRMGMEVIEAQRQPTKGGSIRLTMQCAGGKRPVAASVAEVIADEDKLGLHAPAVFKTMFEKLAGVKMDLLRQLDRLQGNTVAGYGASVGVVTLLYEWELAGRLSFIVDDNERKQGTFSPGQHIPVYAPQALYDRKADAVLVLAWNYADPIMKKHPQFRGKFIIPLPEVRIA